MYYIPLRDMRFKGTFVSLYHLSHTHMVTHLSVILPWHSSSVILMSLQGNELLALKDVGH